MNNIALKSSFALLNTDYVQLSKNWNYKNITSTFYRLYLIDDGMGKLYNPECSLTLEKGYLYLIPSFTTCNYYCDEYLSQYYVAFMEESSDGSSLFELNRRILKVPATAHDLQSIKRILELNPGRDLRSSNNPKVYEKRPVLQSFRELNDRIHLSAYMETNGIILQLLSRFLLPEYFKPEHKSIIPSKISDAINYIQTNLPKSLTVAELAKRANQNADYFSRVFNEHTGERPLPYIQSKRIERAQFLLITTDLPFYEIANETGFENLSYFSRVFKNKTGQTPSEYRRNNRLI